jgi:LemA protein
MKRLVLALAALTVSGCGYNRIQTLDEQVNGYKSQIQVQLQRRADLVPNLVEVVKGYATQEKEIFETLASARAALSGAVQSGDLGSMAQANNALSGALGRLIAIAEDNPEIKSNENFRMLQDQLEGTENRIAVARQDYNDAVRQYNAYIRAFPQVLTAKVIGAGARDYFEAEAGAAEAPKVKF